MFGSLYYIDFVANYLPPNNKLLLVPPLCKKQADGSNQGDAPATN